MFLVQLTQLDPYINLIIPFLLHIYGSMQYASGLAGIGRSGKLDLWLKFSIKK
jgi:hypothetical protein